MCGRYTMFTKAEALAERFHVALPRVPIRATYNAAPSQELPTITSDDPSVITLSTWGFMPTWASGRADVKPIINARAETVATKPFFRSAFKQQRCLILADGFYEWQRTGKGKVPYRITTKDEQPFAFAGISSTIPTADGTALQTFAIITTDANDVVAQIHNRMPVILPEDAEQDWLNEQLALEAAQALLVPYPAALMTAYPVSPKVNSPAYNTPDAVQPVGTPLK